MWRVSVISGPSHYRTVCSLIEWSNAFRGANALQTPYTVGGPYVHPVEWSVVVAEAMAQESHGPQFLFLPNVSPNEFANKLADNT